MSQHGGRINRPENRAGDSTRCTTELQAACENLATTDDVSKATLKTVIWTVGVRKASMATLPSVPFNTLSRLPNELRKQPLVDRQNRNSDSPPWKKSSSPCPSVSSAEKSRSPRPSASSAEKSRSPCPSVSSVYKKAVLLAPPRPPWPKGRSPRPSASSAEKKPFSVPLRVLRGQKGRSPRPSASSADKKPFTAILPRFSPPISRIDKSPILV